MDELPTLRLFYFKNKVNQMALEVSYTVDADLYRKLLDGCNIKVAKEIIQSISRPDLIYEGNVIADFPEDYNRLFILNYYKNSPEIQFLIHELDKRCQLEKCYMDEPYKKKRKRRKSKKETKDNEI